MQVDVHAVAVHGVDAHGGRHGQVQSMDELAAALVGVRAAAWILAEGRLGGLP